MNIFITGTDTNVGKTIVSAWICLHSKAQYWKPIQTGTDSDREIVQQLSSTTTIIPSVAKYISPLSPYDAAKLEKTTINPQIFQNFPKSKTIIEGAGGVLVPIADNIIMADLIVKFNAKALLIVRCKLGMINHTLLSIEALQKRNINIIGIIINGNVEQNIVQTIEKFSGYTVLNILPFWPYCENITYNLKQHKVNNIILEELI